LWLGWAQITAAVRSLSLAPRGQLRFTYFLLWDWSAQKSPDESAVPQDDFRKKIKSFTPKTHFWGPGWLW
jgi:hypothetical protein